VGLPVYNGERFLGRAIDTLLAQTYRDFELIIVDNASSDGTEDICRAYAQRDRRIHYWRNARNLGAMGNFRRVFELARGELFKWAAHDDEHEPAFLEKCVTALDGSHTRRRVISMPTAPPSGSARQVSTRTAKTSRTVFARWCAGIIPACSHSE